MKRRNKIFTVLFLAGMNVSFLHAQMAGNPIGTRGQGQWTMSGVGTYMDQGVGNEWALSKRILLKSGYGLTPWLDVYCIGGGVQLVLKPTSATISDYKDKYRLGYGFGFNMVLKPQSSGFWLMAGAQALRFSSQGSFTEGLYIGGEAYEREFDMRYDWREVRGNIGLIIPSRAFRFYIAGAGWLLQRFDTKREFLTSSQSSSFIGEEEAEFRSGLWTGGIVGIEFLLSQRFSVTIEGLVFNDRNYQVMIGICQTGGSTW